jgi:hypothetical protein
MLAIWYVTYAMVRDSQQAPMRNHGLEMPPIYFVKWFIAASSGRAVFAQLTC